MALVNMLCPRCEVGLQFPVEVPRATFCPACGFAIRGHAHLVQPVPAGYDRVLNAEEFANVSSGCISDSFDPSLLIKIDPEVRKCLSQLKRGTASVIGALVVLYVIDVQFNRVKVGQPAAPTTVEVLSSRAKNLEGPAPSVESLISSLTPSSEEEKNALNTLKEILSVEKPRSLVSWIRDRALFETAFNEEIQHSDYSLSQAIRIEKSPHFTSSATVFYYKVTFTDGAIRHMTVGKTVSEGYKFDWPTYAVLSGMDWHAFLKERVETPTYFRVLAKLEGDSTKPILKLRHPTDKSMPIMEVELDPARGVDREVNFHLKTSLEDEVPMILDLVNVSDSSEPEVQLHALLAKSWYLRTR